MKNNKFSKYTISLLSIVMIFSTLTTVNAAGEESEEFHIEDTLVNENEFEDESIIVEIEDHDHEEEPALYSRSTSRKAPVRFIDFVGGNAKNNVLIYLDSTKTSAYSYTTNNSDSGVFPILDEENGRYKIALSGLIGWIDKDAALNINNYSKSLRHDYYAVNKDNEIIHYISRGANSTSYSGLYQGIKPSDLNMKVNEKYLSYDGIYFYPDTETGVQNMVSDYNDLNNTNNNQQGTHLNSINPKNPYYNYFQWLPIRTQTKLSASDMTKYLQTGYSNNNNPYYSRLYQTEDLFRMYGEYYGSNPALGFATAIHESGYGRSSFSKQRNNYFGHAAYDSSPGLATSYASPGKGIEIHFAKYYNDSYVNQNRWTFFGAFVGNKDMGMNVKYASDPYWGEKIANHYYKMDRAAGFKDYNKYTIGMVTERFAEYKKEPSANSETIYKSQWGGIPVAIISQTDKYYGFLSDNVLDENKNIVNVSDNIFTKYNQQSSIIYLPKSQVKILTTGKDSTLVAQDNTKFAQTPNISKETTTVYTIGKSSLRPDWSANYDKVLDIPVNTKLSGNMTDNGWFSVVYDGHIGYINTSCISSSMSGKPIGNGTCGSEKADPSPTLPKAGNTTMYNTFNLNLRSSVNSSSSIILTIPVGSELIVGESLNDWTHVKYGQKEGYVSSQYLSKEKPTNPAPKPDPEPDPKPPVETYPSGDVNGDKKVSSLDYMIIRNYIMGSRKLTSEETKRADVNGDGRISSADYMRIRNIIMGR